MKPNPTFTLPLTPASRKALKALAHHLDPVVMIGDAGPTAAVIAETRRALAAHELIKIRVRGDDRAARDACLERICESTGAAPVQRIGKLLVIYLPRPVETETAKGPYIPKKRAAVGAGPKVPAPRRAPSATAKPRARPSPGSPTRSPARTSAARGAPRGAASAGPGRAPAKTARSPARSPARSTMGSTRATTRSSSGPTRAPTRSATGTTRTPTRSTGTTRTPTRSTGAAPRATTRSSTSPARPPRAGAPRSRSAPAGARAPQRGGVRRGPKKS